MDRHNALHSSFHGSMRSRESSSTAGSDAREKIKDCLRKFTAFMFTQVGVGALVVCYAILGAASFMHIEKDNADQQLEDVRQWRQKCAEQLWNITVEVNIFNETLWEKRINEVLKVFQNNITGAVHLGYSGRTPEEIWSFPAALMYSLSVFTMIGYGNVVPKTVWGKIATITYACFGIPIYILYFCNMGKVLAQTFKWLYITAHECSRREDPMFEDGESQPIKRKITVPSTACLWVISFYILTGTIMFGAWEKWNYLDSTYFCVISLCKIGFGDFVPGANILDSAGGSHLKLVINFIYVLLGMGLVAMCYNLMSEDVTVKVRELREDLKNCLDDITLKITVCMNDTKYYHQKQAARSDVAGAMLPLRLRRVPGHDGRCNDVLYHPPIRPPLTATPQTLVYFGGDVQDYPEVMQAHRDNKNYLKWNLENMARMLGQLFPTNNIVVVRPTRIEYKSFSCYDNFVPSNNAGVPDHTPTHSALHHLERLLQGVTNRLKAMPASELIVAVTSVLLPEDIDIEDLHNTSIHHGLPDPLGDPSNGGRPVAECSRLGPDAERKPEERLWWRERAPLHETPLTLMGFSKGCVVLNQLIYEFHYTKTLTPGDARMMRFIERIENMYWLDGGHAGGKNTWITARSLLETLTRLNVNIYIHVSPYQVQDEGRPWIGREEKAFTSLLKKLGANVSRYLHASPGMPQSLHMHFEVLANFKSAQDEAPQLAADSSDEDV